MSHRNLTVTAILIAALVLVGLAWPAAPAYAANAAPAAGSLPAGVLGIDTEHLVLRLDDKGLVVTDAVRVINGSSKKAEHLTFSLPEGFTELSFRQGLTDTQVDKTKDGFIARDPLDAGKQMDVAFTYRLPTGGQGQGTINRKIVYPTGNFSIVVQVDQLNLSGTTDLTAGDTVSLNDAVFQEYHRENISAGTTLKVNWAKGASSGSGSATPATGDPSGAKTAPKGLFGRLTAGGPLPIAIFILGLVVVAYGVYAYLGSRARAAHGAAPAATAGGKRAGAVATASQPEDELLARKSELIKEIASLDRRHQAGELDDTTHEAERAAVKAELVQVILALRQAGKS
ncbi:MAG: hypothetical protein ACYC6I_08095 [Bacillota bacterium]